MPHPLYPHHPVVAYLYGWGLLVIAQSGGMAAVAIIFASYLLDLTRWTVQEGTIAAALLAVLTLINCMGCGLGARCRTASPWRRCCC